MDWATRTASLILCLTILLATIHHGCAERKIVCYYTNWSIYRPGTAKFSPQNINPYLCTHLIYAFGGFTKDNALKPFDKYQDIEKGGYAKFTGLKTYNKNLKTLLAIGGWNEGSSRFSPMVAVPERRRELVKNTIKFLRKNHFDGLDLDWEYPAFRDGGKPRDKDNYANLVQELREEFERESSKTGRPRLLLSMAMPAGIEYIDKGYDVPRLNEYLDFINLLSYDYHSSYEPAVNHHSPLYPLEEDNEYNYDTELTIDYTVNYLMKKGASPEKIILGIPTYGRSYTLFNQDATELGAPADGPGVEGDATREKGYLAYYEICENLAESEDWEVIQPNPKAMGPYAFKGDQWVGYDDENIVKLKAKYANEKNLGGIMFWTIDNDDFRGKCHGRPYPLIEAAKEALLTDSTTVQKTQVESRKRTRTEGFQSNTIRKGTSSRRTTTAAPVKRVSSPRPKYRTFSRNKSQEDEEEIDRRSYEPDSEEEESERGNAVRNESKNRPKIRNPGRNRRKQTRRKEGNKEGSKESEESLSNKLTTPEPPTTPDPGTDFKCEDEGFFPHPRDCKKYFWCLESGPGGLGVVAHQFTCPSGLVFNKAADSCDYPRNVVCPKSKTSQSSSTTRAPITAATSRTTYLYSTTRKPTTEKPEDEEYEYYDDEDEEVEEEKKEPKTTTTPKPLLYKTINRSRPTTTTTTEATIVKPENEDKLIDLEDEEDPKVIKELIKLIKKAGGIEQLEKQLLIQDKGSEANSNNENATPAAISRTLYERVLSRQAGKIAGRRESANGPGGAQFEGLEEVPEVKNLRRSHKHQYVTIERTKPATPTPVDEEEAEEKDSEETADVASSEERTVSNPFLADSTQRATPNYVNIRRNRLSTTTSRSENDVEEKNKDSEEDAPVRQRRPSLPSKSSENNDFENDRQDARSTGEENSPTTKSRYVSVQRFRSTTPQPPEASEAPVSQEPTTEPASTTQSPKLDEKIAIGSTTASSVLSIAVSPTPHDLIDPETESILNFTSTESVKLVDDSATEILLTTAPASSTSSSRVSATVSQPRPFGFNRRNRPSESTTPLPSDQRPKVAGSIRLPTLKDLIGYRYDPLLPESGVKDANRDVGKERSNELDLIDKIDYEDGFADRKRIDRRDSLDTVPTTMRGIPLEELRPKVTRGFYITKREPNVTDSTESTGDVLTSTEMTVTDSESSDASILNETNPEKTPEISTYETESAESADRSDLTSPTESSSAETSPTESRRTETSPTERLTETSPTERPTESRRTETSPPERLTTEELTTESTTVLKLNTETDEPSTVPTTVKDNIRQQKFGFGERSQRKRQRGGESVTEGRRRVFVGRRRISTTTSKPIEEVTVKNKSTGNDRESLNEDGTDRIEAEVNSTKNTSAQSPGSLLSTRLRKPVSTQQSKSSNTFTNHRKNRPTGGEHSSESEKHDAVDKTTETAKVEKEIDQSSRAQEIAVTLADPPPQSSTTGRPALRNAFRRKISTTIAPRSDATTTTKSFTPALRGRPRSKDKPVQNATTRPRRPQVIDYDYYEDEEESVIGKSTLNGKLFLTSKGSIRCLDQGNFPHPYSCRKFITCARMVNGLVVGAEYTCPDKLSFDPVGGICNWSAGLGCKD
nr:PREDICTED: nuclear pore complex protein DDB_G0274915 isoform X2 [Megachile rotundata]